MPTLQDLLDNPDLLKRPEPECCMCRKPMTEERHETSEGTACGDCYFRKLGDEIEKHPLGNAGIRRG